MAVATGVNGSVTFLSGHNIDIDRFMLRIGQRMINTTAFGDTYEENTAGLKFGQFMVSGHFEYNATSTAPGIDDMTQAGGSMTFQIASGCTEEIEGVIETFDTESDVNGEARATVRGPTNGALTETWDENPS